MALMKVCPTEKLPQLITFNKYFVKTRHGDDSRISMDMWNVYTNEQTTMSRDGIPRMEFQGRESVGKHHPTSSSSRLLNIMLPSHHHDFHYFFLYKCYSVLCTSNLKNMFCTYVLWYIFSFKLTDSYIYI